MNIFQKMAFVFLIMLATLSLGYVTFSASLTFNVELEVTSAVAGVVQWAIPEGRVGASSTNWDAQFYLTVRTSTTVLFIMPALASTTPGGDYLTPIDLTGITPGQYNVGVKTHQHLTRLLRNVNLVEGTNVFNFTQLDNSPATGTVELLAGDISGAGTTPATLGDDVVNAVDLSVMIGNLDDDDATGRSIRSNVNQDPVVNSVDLSLLLKNLDLEGDR